MHIVIPIHDFAAGGTEIIAFRLAEAWLAQGHRVSVIAGDHAGTMRARLPAAAGCVVLDPPLPRSALSRVRLGAAMTGELKRLAPDIVFLPGNFHFILAHAVKRALPTVPVVAKLSNPLIPSPLAARLMGVIGRGPLRRYLAPIAMTVAMSHGLEAEYRRLAPGLPVCTIFDPNVPDGTAIPAMRDRRANDGAITLLSIARLEPQKNLELAIETLARLRQVRPACLTILGEGALRSKLELHAAHCGVADFVTMPGFVQDPGPYLAAADLLLVTSRYEGGPATAAEALAAAVPVVGTDCSHFLRELLASPELGRISSVASPASLAAEVLALVSSEPAKAEQLAAAINPCRFANAATSYLTLFERLAANRSA